MKSLRRSGKETAIAEPDKTGVEELQVSKGIHRIWREGPWRSKHVPSREDLEH